jgi:hypothetical protein
VGEHQDRTVGVVVTCSEIEFDRPSAAVFGTTHILAIPPPDQGLEIAEAAVHRERWCG